MLVPSGKTFIFAVALPLLNHILNLVLNLSQFLMKLVQFMGKFSDVFLAKSFIDRASDLFNKSVVKEILKNVEALLKYIFGLGIVSCLCFPLHTVIIKSNKSK